MKISTSWEFEKSVVDFADNSTPIHTGDCIVRGIWINAAPTGDCIIKDGSTSIFTIESGTPSGWLPLGDVKFDTSLIIDPDDADTTGNATIVYKPVL